MPKVLPTRWAHYLVLVEALDLRGLQHLPAGWYGELPKLVVLRLPKIVSHWIQDKVGDCPSLLARSRANLV